MFFSLTKKEVSKFSILVFRRSHDSCCESVEYEKPRTSLGVRKSSIERVGAKILPLSDPISYAFRCQ